MGYTGTLCVYMDVSFCLWARQESLNFYHGLIATPLPLPSSKLHYHPPSPQPISLTSLPNHLHPLFTLYPFLIIIPRLLGGWGGGGGGCEDNPFVFPLLPHFPSLSPCIVGWEGSVSKRRRMLMGACVVNVCEIMLVHVNVSLLRPL